MEREITEVSELSEAEKVKKPGSGQKKRWKKDWEKNWKLYALFIPVAVFFIMFNYIPMFGTINPAGGYSTVSGSDGKIL